MTQCNVAFLGLGVMGYPMAGHLASAGHRVCVYNRTESKAQRWVDQFGGELAPTPAQAAAQADVVFACVGNDDDLRSVTTGASGAFSTLRPGSVFVDHTTASAEVARELSVAAVQRDSAFIDAPVSGGQSGAEQGGLTIMCGGSEQTFARVQPLLACYARSAVLMGEVGAGQLTKMVNQICIAGLVQSLSEGVAFAVNAGLDVERVFDVIGKGAAQSWQMDHRHRTMLANEFDFGFAVNWMRKDLALCFAEAARNGSQLPVAQLVDSYYAQVQEAGGERWDTSSLLTRLYRRDLSDSESD